MSDTPEFPPQLAPQEREELTSLAYFLGRLDAMRTRGLISDVAYATVVAESNARRDEIERAGRYRVAIANARQLMNVKPVEALAWAGHARAFDPSASEAWILAFDLLTRLRRFDEARALGAEAGDRFPELRARVEAISDRQPGSATSVTELAEANAALQRGDDDGAIRLCEAVLDRQPDSVDALVLSAFALQRLGHIDESLAIYNRLCRMQPESEVWPKWVRDLQARRKAPETTRPAVVPTPVATPEPAEPRLSWSSVAGEFLQDHWQKLILCMAVLLIVVSSTVGAHLLLGPRLWSPIGKCTLALVYTAMFAAFGAGLTRWGAERAGRMMLLTTLIVVPVNFMLVGETRLLTEPSVSRLGLLVLDAVALGLLTRMVVGALGLGSGANFLAITLVGLSGFDAATTWGVPFERGLAAFLMAPWAFLGSVWWLNTRYRGASDEEHREFAPLALGLLAFALLSGSIRAGVVLHLAPALFSVPVMIAAIACVHTAHHLFRFEKDPGRILSIRFGGVVLSALAFALALARPPGPSPLFSGNALATALLGLALYAAMLRAYRQPAYLYFAFGALFFGYFGAFYFVVDLLRAVEEVARQALGYQQKLPLPFKALNGLVFNAVLAPLSLLFARRWRDDRLARHCHYIGVPFSIAACVLSGFEPKAAVLCMGSYAALYAVAAWLFAQPAVIYLACAAVSGALVFGSILIPGLTLPARALGIADLGAVFWVVRMVLWQREAGRPFYLPLARSALVAAVAAMVAATVATIPPESVSVMSMSAFLVAGLLCGLIVVDEPRGAVAHLAVAGTVGAFLCALELANGRNTLSSSGFAVAVGASSLGLLALLEWTRGRTSTRSTLFTSVMPDSVGVLVVVAIALATPGLGSTLPPVALAYVLGASALLWLSRFRRERRLVGLGIALAVASAYVLSSWRVGWTDVALGMGWISLVSAVAAALLWGIGTTCRRRWNDEFYAVPCLLGSFSLASLVFVTAIEGRLHARTAFPTASLALLLNGLVLVLHTTTWRRSALTFAAAGSLVSATYLALFSVGTPSPDKAYVLGLVGVVEALIFWAVAQFVPWRPREEWERLYALPLFVWSSFLTIFAVLPAHASPVSMTLVGVSFLLMIKSFPAPGWLYASLASFATALWFGALKPLPADWWMASALLGAYALWGLGLLTRRHLVGLRERLALPELAWDFPFFNAATLAGMLAAFLWYDSSSWHAGAWAVRAGVPFALAFFCLLMLKPYPTLPWVHASVVLTSVGIALTASTWLKTPSAWILATMVTANVWFAVSRALTKGEPALCQKFGIARGGYDQSVELWSKLFFGLAAVSAGVVVLSTTATTVFDLPLLVAITPIGDWTCILLTLLLAGVFATAEAESNDDIPSGLRFFYVLLVLGLWWLGVSPSPVLGLLHVAASSYFPITTVALALASVVLSIRPAQADGGEVGGGRSGEFATFLSRAGFVLAVVATLFTAGALGTTTLVTLLAASAAFGLQSVARHRVESGYATGLAWLSACAVLMHVATPLPDTLVLALGGIGGAFTLGALATWLRGTSVGLKSRGVERRGQVVLALERVGLAGAFVSAFSAPLLPFLESEVGNSSGIVAVGVLLGVAVYNILLARRWQAEWLVYFAQATLLGAYFVQRQFLHPSPATDAVVLLAFGYLDLGVAEVLQRLRLGLYARPTLYVSLLLPLLSLSLSAFNGRFDEVSLFAFFATATFYGVAGYTQRWRSLGYVSAVLFNALLWLFWSRVGWRFAENPQFFLIPVGFSAILFAEVNRRDLDRSTVNTIRGLGLSLAYLSLAMPIWQFQSFGAWLTLLLLSLVGIFVGIGLRIQSFLWLGLVGFVLDVVYQLGRMGAEHVIAKWAIMLGLGILLILFVALNEKKRIVLTMREFYKEARQWE